MEPKLLGYEAYACRKELQIVEAEPRAQIWQVGEKPAKDQSCVKK